jgi:exopolyphosphatase/guanosine-5'-triphosphate,3'-diphosphate pyrophosphatase
VPLVRKFGESNKKLRSMENKSLPVEGTLRGVVDLGTNTFHLLIVEFLPGGEMKIIYRERIFVKLAEESIQKIGKKAMQRALEAMLHFRQKLDLYDCKDFKAFGTAALRTASNGLELIDTIKKEAGIQVQLIDGKEEARLIHLGVSQAVPQDDEKQIIMDIGGGSVEFIIADKNKVFWSESFMAGVGILFNEFHKSDPIAKEDVKAVNDYLNETLKPLLPVLKKYPARVLTGASGAFETILDLMEHERINENFAILKVEDFPALYNRILKSTLEERKSMPSIPLERVEMIVVSVILVQWLLDHAPIDKIYVSGYALKEGMLVT